MYIANRPPMPEYEQLQGITPLRHGDVSRIADACGNGWRKVFNVYAKLLFAMGQAKPPQLGEPANWQQLRDDSLLQRDSGVALLFSAPDFQRQHTTHIVMGKHYARQLNLPDNTSWLNAQFAVAEAQRLVVCPYFDYRQLTNQGIVYLVSLLAALPTAG